MYTIPLFTLEVLKNCEGSRLRIAPTITVCCLPKLRDTDDKDGNDGDAVMLWMPSDDDDDDDDAYGIWSNPPICPSPFTKHHQVRCMAFFLPNCDCEIGSR